MRRLLLLGGTLGISMGMMVAQAEAATRPLRASSSSPTDPSTGTPWLLLTVLAVAAALTLQLVSRMSPRAVRVQIRAPKHVES